MANTQSTASVGMYILNLGRFDIATGSFTADFYLSMRCPDRNCLDINFEFMNGRASTMDKIVDTADEKFYRMQAQLASPIDLQRFPFDRQQMQIVLEDRRLTSNELRFVPDLAETGIDDSITFTGWTIGKWSAEVREHTYPAYDESFSQYAFSIPIERNTFNAFLKTFLPIIFIILVMLSNFLLGPDKVTSRLGMVGSALIASVMFHVSMTNQIPPVGYLTFADKFMILTYFIVLTSFALNIWLLWLFERKRTEAMDRIHRRTEVSVFVIVPTLYLLLFIFFS